jgi:hypothetical protein
MRFNAPGLILGTGMTGDSRDRDRAPLLRRKADSGPRWLDARRIRVTAVDARGPGLRGPTAIGALAVGATALGAVAIGRLAIGRAAIKRLQIDELEVGHLRVVDLEIVSGRPRQWAPAGEATDAASEPPDET